MSKWILVLAVISVVFVLMSRASGRPEEPEVFTMDDVRRLALEGRTVEAVKAYRTIHNVTLAEATAAVEKFARRRN